jgi:sirohydrochlorin cobaltochelatase
MTDQIKYGVMICGHGSRSQSAVDEFAAMAVKMKSYFPDWPVEYGYLEFANPVIRVGLDKLREQGVTHVLAVPGMLFAAGHAKNDIPSVLNAYAEETGISIQYGRELAVSLDMIAAAGDRVQQALTKADAASGPVPLSETCLVVIGRGASDPDANSNISKIARMLWEGMGFGWCEVGYSWRDLPAGRAMLVTCCKAWLQARRRVSLFFVLRHFDKPEFMALPDQVANGQSRHCVCKSRLSE